MIAFYNQIIPTDLLTISTTFYEQLLRSQIPKAQKDSKAVSLNAFLGSGPE